MAVIQNIPFNLFGEEVGVGLQLENVRLYFKLQPSTPIYKVN